MKNTSKFLAVGVAGLFLLSGCGGAPTSAASNTSGSTSTSSDVNWNTDASSLKGQTITVLWTDTSATGTARRDLLKQFTKETGINVHEIGVDYDSVYNKVMTAVMSNSSDIDVAEMDTIWAGQFFKGNVAEDLTNVVPKDVQSQFTASSLAASTYQGHLVAVPWYSSAKHFYWNTTLLHKAGIDTPPKTWDEFLTDSKIIQQKLGSQGVYASGWSWKQAECMTVDYVGMVGAFGGSFFDASGKPQFNQPGGVKALQYMSDLMKSGTVDPASLQWTEDDVMNAFAAGKIAMMSNWEGMYPGLNDPKQSKVVNQSQVGLLPGEGSVVSSSCTGSEGLALLKNSKHKQAALEFLKWTAAKEYQLGEFKGTGQYPALQSLFSDAEMTAADESHTLKQISEQFQYGMDRPNAPGYVQWSDILTKEVHDTLMGQGSASDNLATATQKIQQAIQNANN